MEGMKKMPDHCVDLILTDPPYKGVKTEAWDNQWKSDEAYLDWLRDLAVEWKRILKPNGSVYVFASPQMRAKVEIVIGETFKTLNTITWLKGKQGGSGLWSKCCKEQLRQYFPRTEAIIFAESDDGYSRNCGRLKSQVLEPLRAYLDGERKRAGVSTTAISNWFAAHGYPKHSVARHAFSRSQFALPNRENYERLQRCLRELSSDPEVSGRSYEALSQDYEVLKRDYASLKKEFDELRRYFRVTKEVPYTDVWEFSPVQYYEGKHPCEKPLEMIKHIVAASSRPGDVVFDPFAGSATTLVASIELGRRAIGFELGADYLPHATARIKAALNHKYSTKAKRIQRVRGQAIRGAAA